MSLKTLFGLALAALVAACAQLPAPAPGPDEPVAVAWPSADRSSGTQWTHQALPGKAPTEFRQVRKDGRDALAVRATSAASMLRQKVQVAPEDLGHVRFSWMVPELIAQADLAHRDADDSPVRILLAFEGDRSKLSARDAMLSELARTLTGEEMPYATLVYAWCNKREPGSVVKSPRTERIRTLVLESGERRLNKWLDYERDIRADYERAFGEAPGALVGIAIMTDSDNTRSVARAWYGPVRLVPVAAASAR